jgi:CBS domain-containing protein
MRADDMQVSLPVVRRETTAVEAGRLIADSGLVGLVVANRQGVPAAIISAVDVLRLMVPGYLLDDVSLAGVFDEAGSGELWEHLSTGRWARCSTTRA